MLLPREERLNQLQTNLQQEQIIVEEKKKATEPKATKNTKSPFGVLKKEEVRSPTLNA